ncbi:hypothetical protein Tph_c14760 [Thermacetogenium phaeum DSM 12270]|uniref:Uncharacterized protein n=1 Tax=Thermacetogenium phaeum (strain ATCC BAA-254 / DSM 26808 / PB) TaxID=1089553 RepID=K4LI95_THEPS|nr:hypothetical protein [Thermacetogenium phaeum]AFV11685.1 hypothetical protein Tph_c14760 [Thermacetogenium phaeum DSM 12270]
MLKSLPPDTKEVISEIADVQLRTKDLLEKLEQDIAMSEEMLNEKKEMLDKLEKQHDLLKLTPEQLKLIQDYNKSIGESTTFKDWIMKRDVKYDLIASFIISAVFFWLGLIVGKKKFKNS